MKLRNKLIPLASCLAVGATVAPISLTACTSSTFVDLKDGFIPTIKKLAVDGYKLTAEKAEEMYFNAVSENPDIFVQDYNWSMSGALRAIETLGTSYRGASKLNNAKAQITNVKVGTTKYVYRGETYTSHTISFDYVREQSYTINTRDTLYETSGELEITGKTTATLSAKNIPVTFSTSGGGLLSDNSLGKIDPEAPSSAGLNEYYYDLGRGITTEDSDYYYYIWSTSSPYLYSQWILSIDMDALYYMTDNWSIDYSMTTDDTVTLTYNDVKSSANQTANFAGEFHDGDTIYQIYYEYYNEGKNKEAVDALNELESWKIKSYYLQDIARERKI